MATFRTYNRITVPYQRQNSQKSTWVHCRIVSFYIVFGCYFEFTSAIAAFVDFPSVLNYFHIYLTPYWGTFQVR